MNRRTAQSPKRCKWVRGERLRGGEGGSGGGCTLRYTNGESLTSYDSRYGDVVKEKEWRPVCALTEKSPQRTPAVERASETNQTSALVALTHTVGGGVKTYIYPLT